MLVLYKLTHYPYWTFQISRAFEYSAFEFTVGNLSIKHFLVSIILEENKLKRDCIFGFWSH